MTEVRRLLDFRGGRTVAHVQYKDTGKENFIDIETGEVLTTLCEDDSWQNEISR